MKIAALDPSLTSLGIATGRDGQIGQISTIAPGNLRGHERLALLLRHIDTIVSGADVVIIEGLAYGAKGSALLDLAGLHWLIRHELWQDRRPYVVISPSSLKQYATANGMANKALMVATASRRFPTVELQTEDEAVALWLLAAGFDYYGMPMCQMPQAQRAVLTARHTKKPPAGARWQRGDPVIQWAAAPWAAAS